MLSDFVSTTRTSSAAIATPTQLPSLQKLLVLTGT